MYVSWEVNICEFLVSSSLKERYIIVLSCRVLVKVVVFRVFDCGKELINDSC